MARQSTIDAFLGSKILRKPVARAASSESILSCITVNNEVQSSSAEDIASTPPTSIDGGSSIGLANLDTKTNEPSPSVDVAAVSVSTKKNKKMEDEELPQQEEQQQQQQQQQQPMARSRRARSGVVTYNENALIRNTRAVTIASSTPAQREITGSSGGNDKLASSTAVASSPSKQARDKLVQDGIQALDLDWQVDALPGEKMSLTSGKDGEDAKKGATRSRGLLRKASATLEKAKTVLGKRTREIIDVGKGEAKDISRRASLRARDLLQQDNKADAKAAASASEEPDAKKRRISKAQTASSSATPAAAATGADKAAPASDGKRKPAMRARLKRYHREGLYIGQEMGFDPRFKPGDNSKRAQKARAKQQELANGGTSISNNSSNDNSNDKAPDSLPPKKRSILPLPMWAGRRLIQTGRDFKMPFDVFNPLPPGQPKPDEWRKTARNVFIGDAAEFWKTSKKLEYSTCVCTADTGCDEDCFNRFMFYECDKDNCAFGADQHCSNRAFEDLRRRVKKGGKYNIGVEVMKTESKGYGVRSCRTFGPGQIIVEYTGEIITQEECDHRTRTIYKDNECFYLMMFDQNMIIDATRGSIARFVNHSCEPNCRMVKWTVDGKPRMALFAGDSGIMTGEELTYDYNFDPFSAKNIQECHCGMASCRGVLGPRPVKERDGMKLNPGESSGTSNNNNVSSSRNTGASAGSGSSNSSALAGAKRKLKDALAGAKSKKRRLSEGASSMLQQVKDAAAKKKEEEEKKEDRAARAALRADIKSARSSRLVAAKLTKKRQPVVSASRDGKSGKVTVKVGRRTSAVAAGASPGAVVVSASASNSPARGKKGKGKSVVLASPKAKGAASKAARVAKASALGSLGVKAAAAVGTTGTMRRNVDSVRSNVVRTIRGAAAGRGARGKTIKLVQPGEDEDGDEEEGEGEGEEGVVVVNGPIAVGA